MICGVDGIALTIRFHHTTSTQNVKKEKNASDMRLESPPIVVESCQIDHWRVKDLMRGIL